MFTPYDADGEIVTLRPASSSAVATADYLSFGYWLYQPDGATSFDPVDFGVLAGGGDPFEMSHFVLLTGTASYTGSAAGMYYTGGLSDGSDVGSFEADVELTADFGTSSDDGTLEGRIYGFDAANGFTSFPSEVGFGGDGSGICAGRGGRLRRSFGCTVARRMGCGVFSATVPLRTSIRQVSPARLAQLTATAVLPVLSEPIGNRGVWRLSARFSSHAAAACEASVTLVLPASAPT